MKEQAKLFSRQVLYTKTYTVIPRYNAVRLARVLSYAPIAFQPFLRRAPFPPAVTLFVPSLLKANWKCCRRKWAWPNISSVSQFALRGWRKLRKI
jgi:hypothetical protein